MVEDILYFIQPHVLDRLLTGKFVAKRQQNKAYQMRDRRDLLSPLNVTRRAIRYEPLVFSNRQEEIIAAVEELNKSHIKLLLVSGPSGRGKTTFIRGIVEMMGGGKEQLLWFDVSRHTDFDEVIRFLIEYMTYIFRTFEAIEDIPENPNPVTTLELLLRKAAHFPILIVIDNMEYLVAPDQTVRSRELKEAFNFLLSFPNVKLILAGKLLPFADMNPAAAAVYNIPLAPLTDEKSDAMVKELFRNVALKEKNYTQLIEYFHGESYMLFLFGMLYDRHPEPAVWLQQLSSYSENPERVLLSYLYQHLSETEQRILAILALIRHGATPSGLQAIVKHCEPELEGFQFKQLDQSFIRLLLKKVYPPQMVLNKLSNRNKQQGDENDSIEAYYQVSEIFQDLIVQSIPDEDQSRYHERLQDFYVAEKNKHILERVYQARIRHLVAEAQYHHNHIRKRRLHGSQSEPFSTEGRDPQADISFRALTPLAPHEYPPASPMPVASEPTAESDIPWPPMSVLEGKEPIALSAEEEDLVSPAVAETTPRERQAMDAPLQKLPISIQFEPVVSAPQSLRLSEEDLQKLAELITRGGSARSSSAALPYHGGTGIPAMENAVVNSPEDLSQPSIEEDARAEREDLSELALSDSDANELEIHVRLNEAMAAHDRQKIAQELLYLAHYRHKKGLYQNAEACLLKAMDFAKMENSLSLELEIHGVLGSIYQERFQHNKALRHLREAEHLYEMGTKSAADKDVLAHAYEDMAEIFFYRKELKEALTTYKKCLALKPDDKVLKADVLFRLALAFDEAGRLKQAVRYYRESYEVNEALHDDPACAATLYNLASLYFEQAMFSEAGDTMQKCLIYDRRIGANKDIFRSLMLLSKIGEAQHSQQQADAHALEAYRMAHEAVDKTNMATACLRLGHLAEASLSWKQAAQYYAEAQSIATGELSEESQQLINQKLASIQEHLV